MAQNQVDIVLRAVDNASRTLRQVRDSVSGIESAYRSALGPSKAVATAVAAAGTAALGTAGYMVRLAGQLEQTEIAFTTMLGSAEEAQAFLDDLADTAARTPFNLTGLQNASRLLLAFGFQAKDTIPIVTTLGDAVSALGGGDAELQGVIRAIGQIQAKGKVSAEELLQLAERGIPAYEILGEQLGLTGDQVANIGTLGIDAATGINALLAGLGERFAGAMDAQSKTLLGMLSNVQDEATRVAQLVGDEIIEIFNLKPALDTAIETLGTLRTRIEDVGLKEVLRGIADEAMIAAGALTGAMIPAIINMAIMIGRATVRLAPWIAGGAIAADVIRRLGTETEDVLPILQRLVLGFQGIAEMAMAVGGAIAELIAGQIRRITWMVERSNEILGLVSNTAEALARGATIQQVRNLWSDTLAANRRAGEEYTRQLEENANASWRAIYSQTVGALDTMRTAVAGSSEEVAAAVTPALDALSGVADSVADVTAQLTTPLDQTGLLDVATDLDGVTTSANDAAAAVTGLRNAWGLPDAAVRGANAGEADRIRQDTETAMDQAGYRPVTRPSPSARIIPDSVFAAREAFARLDESMRTVEEMADRAADGGIMRFGDSLAAIRDEAFETEGVYTTLLRRAIEWRQSVAEQVDAMDTSRLANQRAAIAIWDQVQAEDASREALRRLEESYASIGVAHDREVTQNRARAQAYLETQREAQASEEALRRLNASFEAVAIEAPKARDSFLAAMSGPNGILDLIFGITPPGTGPGAPPDEGEEVEQVGTVTDVLVSSLQGLANQVPAVGAAIQGFMTAGPWGALVAGVTDLLGESDAFKGIMEQLGNVLQPIVETFTTLLDALAPVIDVVFALIEVALYPLTEILEHVVAPVFEGVARLVATIWNAIAGAINATVSWLFGFALPTVDIGRDQTYRPTGPEEERDRDRASSPGSSGGRSEVNFGTTPQGVQLAVATPLVQAADTMIRAAEMMVDAQMLSGVDNRAKVLADHSAAMRDHTAVMRAWVENGIDFRVELPRKRGPTRDRAAALANAGR